jgi:hypothetical protein
MSFLSPHLFFNIEGTIPYLFVFFSPNAAVYHCAVTEVNIMNHPLPCYLGIIGVS